MLLLGVATVPHTVVVELTFVETSLILDEVRKAWLDGSNELRSAAKETVSNGEMMLLRGNHGAGGGGGMNGEESPEEVEGREGGMNGNSWLASFMVVNHGGVINGESSGVVEGKGELREKIKKRRELWASFIFNVKKIVEKKSIPSSKANSIKMLYYFTNGT